MSRTLEDKVVLITGSGSGMGRSHAVLMAERGARVAVHDIDPDRVTETADLVRSAGAAPHEICVDMRDTDALAEAIAKTERDYGPVDVLVNNAGIGGQGLALGDIDVATFDAMFEVHVRGTFFATKAVIPGMKVRRAGKIVNISSNFAMGGCPFASHYAAAKSAISGLTKSWAREFAPSTSPSTRSPRACSKPTSPWARSGARGYRRWPRKFRSAVSPIRSRSPTRLPGLPPPRPTS